MLGDFVLANREEIVSRCRATVAGRSSPPPTAAEIDHGVPMFLEELMDALHLNVSANADVAATATTHGRDLLRRGFTPSQLVHDYGDICQTITRMAIESRTSISAEDFRTLNQCLDNAIAAAITEYQRERDASISGQASHGQNRQRVLGAALQVAVQAARGAYEAIRSGGVGMSGSTGMVLAHSFQSIEDLNERLQRELQLS